MNAFVLKLLDRFKPFFVSSGIDYPVMKKILEVKFKMDERRVPTVMMNGRDTESKNSFRSSLLLYLVLGVIIAVFMIIPVPLFLKMNIILGMLIFMITTTMISDFSSVLLDVKDKNILLPRPVDPRTLNAAKFIHIIVYLFSISMAISGASLVLSLIRYGVVFFLIFLLEVILICGFVILITSLLYYVILTLFSGEKLKDIINYFQITLTVFMTVMYQLIGRIFNFAGISNFTPPWWGAFLPSMWFAAPFSVFMEHQFNPYYIFLCILAVVIPVIALAVYLKAVAPRFEKNLQKLNESSGKRVMKRNSVQFRIANVICKGRTERVFYRFTQQMLANERKLKLKLYPSLALTVALPLIFFLSLFGKDLTPQEFSQITQGKYYLYLYLSVSMFPALFMMISASENYKGAWIYRTIPLTSPVPVLKGAFKGFVFKYVVPIYLIMCIIITAIFGFRIIPDEVLIFINSIVLMLTMFHFSKKELPFYRDFQLAQNSKNSVMVFITFGICGVLAAIHYSLITLLPFGVTINIVLSLLAAVCLWRVSFRITWDKITE